VSVDVRAPVSGLLVACLGSPDDVVEVGKPLMSIDTSAAKADAAPAAAPLASPKAETPKAAAPVVAAPAAASTAAAAPKPAPVPEAAAAAGARGETRVKMTRMRQTVSRRLKESQNTYAMLTTFQECDMGNLIDLRNK